MIHMLLRLIRAEQMKLKRSPVWIAFLLMPIVPAVLGTINYLGNLELLTSEWYSPVSYTHLDVYKRQDTMHIVPSMKKRRCPFAVMTVLNCCATAAGSPKQSAIS